MDEWDRHRHETAKAWLDHVRGLGRDVQRARDMRDRFEALADGARGIDYTREKVGGGQWADRLAEALCRLEEAQAEWAANLAAYAAEAEDAARRIGMLEDPAERAVLSAYYVDGAATWDEVARGMGYSVQRVYQVRESATVEAYEVLPPGWRDPRHPAV